MTTKSSVPLDQRIRLTDSTLRANVPRPRLDIAEYFVSRELNDFAGIVTLVIVEKDDRNGRLLNARGYIKREGSWIALTDEANNHIRGRHHLPDVYDPGDPVYDAF